MEDECTGIQHGSECKKAHITNAVCQTCPLDRKYAELKTKQYTGTSPGGHTITILDSSNKNLEIFR